MKRPPEKKPPAKKSAPAKNSKTPAPPPLKGKAQPAAKTKAAAPPATSNAQVAVYELDPESGIKPVKRSTPSLTLGTMPISFLGTAQKAGTYAPGSAGFRYWNCAEALRRSRDLWRPYLADDANWQHGSALEVQIGVSHELAACYDRKTLTFNGAVVHGKEIHSADSPDVVAHEAGHAILDAVRPDLWDAALDEVSSFHESFADLTAMLSALHIESVAAAVLKETGGHLYRDSVVSRFAPTFGKAVHSLHPQSSPENCLRNAANAFFYREPMHLPPVAPHFELSSEPHSFSRLFTSGFFEAMGGMLAVNSTNPRVEDILQTAKDATALLAKAVRSAALSAAFYSEVAAQVIWADGALFGGKYDDVLRSAFVRRGLLSLEAVRSLRAEAARLAQAAVKPGQAGDERPRGRDMMIRASAYGLAEGALVVRTASFSRRGAIAPAALDSGSTPVPGVEQATQSFLETLFRRGRVDFSQCKPGLSSVPHAHVRRKTHYILEQNGQFHLRRRCFDDGAGMSF